MRPRFRSRGSRRAHRREDESDPTRQSQSVWYLLGRGRTSSYFIFVITAQTETGEADAHFGG